MRVHTYPAPMAKFNEFRYELLPHPAYSPDLVLCDYFLFPNLKKWFGENRFTIKEQLITETGAYFEGLDKLLFGWLEKVKKLLDQVYRAERRLCWEIKMNRSKKCVLLCFFKNLLTCPNTIFNKISFNTNFV